MAPVTTFAPATGWFPRRRRFSGKTLIAAAAGLCGVALLAGLLLQRSPAPQLVVVQIPAAAPKEPAVPAAEPPASAPPPPGAAAAAPAPPPTPPAIVALPPAPDPALAENTTNGPLPIVSRDGRQPWMVYARPFDRGDKRPRVAMLIAGLGLSKLATQNAIRNLPPDVTLSFMPYHPVFTAMQEARAAGHETVVEVPMEPLDYPRQDPGPAALLVSLDSSQNLERLHWMMGRGTGYIGMMTYMGSRFAGTPDQLRPVLQEIKARGLAFVDNRTSADAAAMRLADQMALPRGLVDRRLETEVSRAGIEQQLGELEELARRNGSAIGVGTGYPVTIQAVASWAAHLDAHGIALAPLSAVLTR
jgi:polysaccharide deacetylase 2 family uncharacterized protein YibQ